MQQRNALNHVLDDGLPHCIGMPKAGSQAIQTVPAGFLHTDPAVKPASPKGLENRGMGAGTRARHHRFEYPRPFNIQTGQP